MESSQFSYRGRRSSYEKSENGQLEPPGPDPIPDSSASDPPPPPGPPPGRPGASSFGSYTIPGSGFPYGYLQPPPPPQIVRHTLTRRNWLLVVVVASLLSSLVGSLFGAVVGIGSQQTIIERYFPNKSVLARPEDVQSILAAVEPAVVSIESQSIQAGSPSGGDFVEAAGTGMILTPQGEVLTNNHVVAEATTVTVTLCSGRPRHVPHG